MPTTTQVNDLKINRLTQAQYDAAVQGGIIGENEISIITDAESGQVIQVDTMPTAAADEVGKIYQYVGTTDANYTNGYFYKCVSDGQEPATYSWTRVDVQPQVDPLPSQSGQSGKFLTTDGTDASWSDKPLVNNATGSNSLSILGNEISASRGTAIGKDSYVSNMGGTSCGYLTKATGIGSVALGAYAVASGLNSIQLGSTSTVTTNRDDNTFKVANNNGNFEIMSADGTIPEARLADTTNATAGQTLVLNSQGNAEWKNITSSPATMPTLAVADWVLDSGTNKYTQTVNVTDVTATNVVYVAPFPTNADEYAQCNVLAVSQGAGTIGFQADVLPTNALGVNVVVLS